MKRKIVRQGVATLTVSLPSKWTKKFNLTNGDEVDVEERDAVLVISSEKSPENKREVLDLSKFSILLKRIVIAKYLKGVDEIEVKFDTADKGRVLQKRIRDTIGMEVINQGKDFLVIKDISGGAKADFDPILKRVFSMLNAVIEESLNSLKRKETDLAYLEDMESNINRVSDHCFRILNKYGHPEYSKTPVLYIQVLLLEQLADEFKILTKYITDNELVLEPSVIALYGRIQKLFKTLEELFHEFSYETAVRLARERDAIISDIDKRIDASKSVKEAYVLRSFREITELIVRMMGQTLTLA